MTDNPQSANPQPAGPPQGFGNQSQPQAPQPGQQYAPQGQPMPGQPYPGQYQPQPGQPYPPQGQPYPGQPQVGQDGRPVFVAPPKEKASIGKIITIILGVIFGLVALAIALFFIVGPRIGRGDYKNAIYHPVGPSNVWLHPGYAQGYDLGPAGAMPYGFSLDQTVGVYAEGQSGERQLVGRDLRTNEIVWSDAITDCSIEPVMDGKAYCVVREEQAYSIYGWDIKTGEKALIYSAPFPIQALENVGVLGEATILSAADEQGRRILSFRDEGAVIDWQTVVNDFSMECKLIDEYLACSNNTTYGVLDARTGEQTVPWTALGDDRVEWLADGYYTRIDAIVTDDLNVDVHDFQGNVITTIPYPSSPNFPNHYQNTYYPHTDEALGLSVRAITADGKVFASFGGYDSIDALQWNKSLKVRSVDATAADGSVIFARDGDEPGFHTKDGRVAELDADANGYDYRIVDGIIVYSGGLSDSQVLIPKG